MRKNFEILGTFQQTQMDSENSAAEDLKVGAYFKLDAFSLGLKFEFRRCWCINFVALPNFAREIELQQPIWVDVVSHLWQVWKKNQKRQTSDQP